MTKRFIQLLAAFRLTLTILGNCQQAPTVDTIIARHIEAIGGAQKIAAIHSIVFRFTYREGDFAIPDVWPRCGRTTRRWAIPGI